MARPRNGAEREDPESLTLNVVETVEIAPPKGAKPLHWRLYTTLPVDSPAAAADVVRLYRLRWRIEEVFRVLKSDGLKLEDTQVEAAERLFKLAALGLGAATRIIQLTDARDGSRRPATDVVDGALIAPIAAIGKTLEGNTARQKNHHPTRLARLARLDHGPARRLELLLQTTGTKDHGHGMETARRQARRLPHGSRRHDKPIGRCVNPVGPWGRRGLGRGGGIADGGRDISMGWT